MACRIALGRLKLFHSDGLSVWLCYPRKKKEAVEAVGRILESDACSQNKICGAEINVGYKYAV